MRALGDQRDRADAGWRRAQQLRAALEHALAVGDQLADATVTALDASGDLISSAYGAARAWGALSADVAELLETAPEP